VLRKEDFMVIQALVERGVYQKDIAEQLGVHRKTVSRALRLGPGAASSSAKEQASPVQATVDGWVEEGIWNVVIQRMLEELGYTGRISIVRDYIRPKRPLRKSRATVRFETPPGRQLQSDWGSTETRIGGEVRPVEFIVNTLSYSRRFHFWCTDSQDAEHTYEGLVRSFEYFPGVPREVLVDNQKVAVAAHRVGERPVSNPGFIELAKHYGFTPRPCRPNRAQTKGKDERMVGYIKDHFFVRPFTCTRCGARMKILVFIAEASVIKRALDHLDRKTSSTSSPDPRRDLRSLSTTPGHATGAPPASRKHGFLYRSTRVRTISASPGPSPAEVDSSA